MNAIFPSSRPNISVRVLPKIPATMIGAGGIGISKKDGVWIIEPNWDDLQLIAPGILLDPSTKELWVHDPVTDVYYRMTLAGLGQALWWGSSVTPNLIGAGPKTFVTQAGKNWLPGMFIQAFSTSVISNYMIGQVTAYVDTSITINVLASGGAGTPSDWVLVPSTLPGSGPPGADGVAGGLNYQFVASLSGDPGAGNVAFNSGSVAGITEIRISKTDRNGVSLTADLVTWDDSTTSANRAKVRVFSPVNPAAFVISTINGPLVDGGAFITYPVTNPVGTTLPVVGDCQVEMSRTGDIGQQGPPGTNGTNGTNGIDGVSSGARYAWNTNTSATDPAAGGVKTNNADPTAATLFMINDVTALGQNVAAAIASWDDSTTTSNRGSITVQSLVTPARFLSYRVSGNITDNGTWTTVPVNAVAGTSGFLDGEAVQITFARSGDQGAAGAGTGDMVGANNLSEITNPSTARANIGAAASTISLTAGAGLTGGGSLAANRSFDVGAGTGITVNTDNVALTVPVSVANGGTGAITAAAALTALGALSKLVDDSAAGVITFAKASGYTEAALTYGATVNWDTVLQPVCTLLLAGNATMAAPTNVVTGRVYTIRIQQNAASTVAWAANYKFAGASVPVITATASAVDRFTFIGRAGNVLEEIGRAQGIA